MRFFKKNTTPNLPPVVAGYLEEAPEGARKLKASIIYSVEKGKAGMIFEDWRDENYKPVKSSGVNPPFHTLIPEDFANSAFKREKGSLFLNMEEYGY